jgi:hypothetical protein
MRHMMTTEGPQDVVGWHGAYSHRGDQDLAMGLERFYLEA